MIKHSSIITAKQITMASDSKVLKNEDNVNNKGVKIVGNGNGCRDFIFVIIY